MTLRFGEFVLSEAERTLRRGALSVHLTPKAFDLLLVLASEAPRVVAKSELHRRVWPDTFVSDATLVGVIKELRRALDNGDRQGSLIRTVNRIGYALTLTPSQSARAESWHWLVSRGRHIALNAGENKIGRDPASAVWLDHAGVSRLHARVLVSDGEVTLEDLRSKNGTHVAGERLTDRVILRDGDRIDIGSEVMVYRCSAGVVSTVSLDVRRKE
jgi:DNA-binding winged helix-turn-helix (wHTH) protein